MEHIDDLRCIYQFASGASFRDCVFLGHRYLDSCGDGPDESDYWTLGTREDGPDNTATWIFFSCKNYLTDIWRSLGGTVFVTDATQQALHQYDDIFKVDIAPDDYELDFYPEGLWGLSDEQVFVWGSRAGAAPGQIESVAAMFGGGSGEELPLPGKPIASMHGLEGGPVYAVGFDGFCAWWDGAAWHPVEVPTQEQLTNVFVVSSEEVYATGRQGSVFQGNGRGFKRIHSLVGGMPANAVAMFNGELYLAGGAQGLFRRAASGGFDCIKPNVKATWFDARGHLVITCDDCIVGTSDGQNFWSAADDHLRDETREIEIAEPQY